METCPLHRSSIPAWLLFPWTSGQLEAEDGAVRRQEACFSSCSAPRCGQRRRAAAPPSLCCLLLASTRGLSPRGTRGRLGCQSTSTSGPRSGPRRRGHRGTRCLAFPRPSAPLLRQMSFLLVFHRGGNAGSENRVGVQDRSLGVPDTSTCALGHGTGRPAAPTDLWSVGVPSVEPAVSGGGGWEGSPSLSLPELEKGALE